VIRGAREDPGRAVELLGEHDAPGMRPDHAPERTGASRSKTASQSSLIRCDQRRSSRFGAYAGLGMSVAPAERASSTAPSAFQAVRQDGPRR
jgi:hypothetical protein